MTQRKLIIRAESWPLKQRFSISRGSKISADVLSIEIKQDGHIGRGEAVPYKRYGESIETVTAAVESIQTALENGLERAELLDALLPGAARNAIDCALWDLEAKRGKTNIAKLTSIDLKPITTAFTIVIDDADKMATQAEKAQAYPLLKIKLGGREGVMADITRLAAIAEARPDAQLIVDSNEGWQIDEVARYADQLGRYGVIFFEQPVPQTQEAGLDDIDLPFCADESMHDSGSLCALPRAYDWINLKLDKTGGLTEALACAQAARSDGRKIMVGCMIATSLSMAPAMVLAQLADLVDLDGPLWLAEDLAYGLRYDGATIYPPDAKLWG
ncbi:MAG: dipeptide epimerase [Rhodobiaceae bacterium]|nr:dipeptide epimerase [Rhodobiaceae bacterium]